MKSELTQNGFTASQIKAFTGNEMELVAYTYSYSDEFGNNLTELQVTSDLYYDAKHAPFDGRCACCGSTRLRYNCVVVHKPTLKAFHVGFDCASTLDNLGQFSTASMKYLKERAQAKARLSNWSKANPQHADILAWASTPNAHYIAKDLLHKVSRYGNLSDKQVELLYKLKAQADQLEARKAADAEEAKNAAPFPESGERIKVAGIVLSFKDVETQYGVTTKMLVKGQCGNKFWGSVPSNLECYKGSLVEFFAKCEKSKDDEHFGFFSRPTKAKLVEEATA